MHFVRSHKSSPVPGKHVTGLNGIALAEIAAGGILLWSGVTGKGFGVILKTTLGGKPTPVGTGADQLGSLESSDLSATGTTSDNNSTTTKGQSGASTGTAAANQLIARPLAAAYGWYPGTQWNDLVFLWNKESGWSNTADNPASGAYGIAQALPPTKYPAAGQASGGSSAAAQISWGLSYIKSRYGNPSAAWAHEVADNWY